MGRRTGLTSPSYFRKIGLYSQYRPTNQAAAETNRLKYFGSFAIPRAFDKLLNFRLDSGVCGMKIIK